MFLLQANTSTTTALFLGTIGMLVLTIGLVVFIIMHQRRVQRFQQKLQQMEIEQQKMMLNASIKMQEEEGFYKTAARGTTATRSRSAR